MSDKSLKYYNTNLSSIVPNLPYYLTLHVNFINIEDPTVNSNVVQLWEKITFTLTKKVTQLHCKLNYIFGLGSVLFVFLFNIPSLAHKQLLTSQILGY